MSTSWSTADLARIDEAEELEIAIRRPDDTLRRWTPIWVVVADRQVYVRTWHRRSTGWFGHAVGERRARIRVPGVECDVVIEDLGDDQPQRVKIDDAYRAKYARYGGATIARMISDDAVAATLRLDPDA